MQYSVKSLSKCLHCTMCSVSTLYLYVLTDAVECIIQPPEVTFYPVFTLSLHNILYTDYKTFTRTHTSILWYLLVPNICDIQQECMCFINISSVFERSKSYMINSAVDSCSTLWVSDLASSRTLHRFQQNRNDHQSFTNRSQVYS